MNIDASFGHFFRERRRRLGLSLREFCRRHRFDPGNVSRLESGVRPPPKSLEVLGAYAAALQLQPETDEWRMFHDLAAAERLPLVAGDPDHAAARTLDVLSALRGDLYSVGRRGARRGMKWVTGTDLTNWAERLDARSNLPELVRRLVRATASGLKTIDFWEAEASERAGWDGIVTTTAASLWVPSGTSAWELSTSKDVLGAAEENFKKRTRDPLGLDRKSTTFVFVTPRDWVGRREWENKKRDLGNWKDVRAYDAQSLAQWLEDAPAVDVWLAGLMGIRTEGVIDIEKYCGRLTQNTDQRLTPEIFLAPPRSAKDPAKRTAVTVLREWLAGPPSFWPSKRTRPTK